MNAFLFSLIYNDYRFLILGKLIGAGFLNAPARNLKDEKKLLTCALLGFVLTEAIALFGLIAAFLILFGL